MSSNPSNQRSPTRIYLRLIAAEEQRFPEAEQLALVRTAAELALRIEWAYPPEVHPRGGYIISGTLPADLDLEAALIQLREAGYIAAF
jgi:hypothetical protein